VCVMLKSVWSGSVHGAREGKERISWCDEDDGCGFGDRSLWDCIT